MLLLELLIFEFYFTLQLIPIIYHHHIYEITFLEACTIEITWRNPSQAILLLALSNLYEKTLNFVDDCWHGCIKRREYLLISMTTVNWFTSFTHYHEVFGILIKLRQIIICYFHIWTVLQCGIYFLWVKESLNTLMLCKCSWFAALTRLFWF